MWWRITLHQSSSVSPGAAGLIWFVLWAFLVFNSPSTHPRISEQERLYITSSLKNEVTPTTHTIHEKNERCRGNTTAAENLQPFPLQHSDQIIMLRNLSVLQHFIVLSLLFSCEVVTLTRGSASSDDIYIRSWQRTITRGSLFQQATGPWWWDKGLIIVL